MSAVVLAAGLNLALAAGTDPLEALMWDRRVLVILAPTPHDARAVETGRRLDTRTCEVANRDLTTVLAPARGEGRIDNRPLARAEIDAVRARFRACAEEFAVILIGKDSGEKVRLTEPPALDEIFSLIDAMPMRRVEIRARGPVCRG